MATIKSYTDIPQSKVLAKILLHNSADMFYVAGKGEPIFIGNKMVACGNDDYDALGGPDVLCWSLAALLGILPILERKGYQKAKPILSYNVAINKWIVDSHVYTTDAYDNPVDACCELILKLHELKKL